ncbi:MAG: aminotransferase class III-fold pyridoxal phosphate-dependent enzyme, partial [Rhodospirillaceae bacterium]|nr:aminotransferase class III-fold pyridoxal phosphate-dependent enzyme [Rhodospirillaceae bacterium]
MQHSTNAKNTQNALMEITSRPAIVFTKGRGSWLYDSDGKAYLDFIQGWAVNCLGHSPAALVAAISDQAETLINASPAFFNQPMLDLAAALTGGAGLDQLFFANSGAEANEGAIKLARKWGQLHRNGAYEIITT